MAYPLCKLESDIDHLLEEDSAFGVAVHQGDDVFPMNLMSNENITWTVERERGISFDLTTLYDAEAPTKPDMTFDVKREIKLEAESGVKDSTFGHPFGQCRPMPQPRPPSPAPLPFALSAAPPKRGVPFSFEERQEKSPRKWGKYTIMSDVTRPVPAPSPSPILGRTRSQGVRLSKCPDVVSSIAASSPPTRGKSAGGEYRAPRRRSGGVDTAALRAELGLVDNRHRCARSSKGSVYRVGAYTLDERAALVAKFHAKRGRRIWRKKIKYDCRKKLADKRPRLKGRFVTQEELDGLDQETLAKVTGLSSYEPDSSSSSDAEYDSDTCDSYTRRAAPTRQCRDGSRLRNGGEGNEQQDRLPVRVRSVRQGSRAKGPSVRRGGAKKETQGSAEMSHTLLTAPAFEAESSESDAGYVSNIFEVTFQGDSHEEQSQRLDSEDETIVRVESYDSTDLVSCFMIDDVLSNNFAIVPTREIEVMSAGVTVN